MSDKDGELRSLSAAFASDHDVLDGYLRDAAVSMVADSFSFAVVLLAIRIRASWCLEYCATAESSSVVALPPMIILCNVLEVLESITISEHKSNSSRRITSFFCSMSAAIVYLLCRLYNSLSARTFDCDTIRQLEVPVDVEGALPKLVLPIRMNTIHPLRVSRTYAIVLGGGGVQDGAR